MLPGENQGMLKYSETMFSLLLLLLSASSTFAASCNSDDDCSDNNGPNFCNPVGNYKYCYNCNSCAQYSCTSSKCNSDPPATTCSNKNVGPCEAGKYCKVTSYSSSCSNCASGRFTSCKSSATSCSYCSGTTSGYPNSVCSAPSKSTGCETGGDNMPCQHTNATIPNLDSCYCGYRRCTSSTGLLCDKLTKTCSKKSYQLVAPFNVSALLVSLLVFGLLLAVAWYLCLRFAPGQHHYIIYKGSKSSKSHGRKTIITPTTSTTLINKTTNTFIMVLVQKRPFLLTLDQISVHQTTYYKRQYMINTNVNQVLTYTPLVSFNIYAISPLPHNISLVPPYFLNTNIF